VATIDIVMVCVVALVAISLCLVLARQRYMLRAAGAIPLSLRRAGGRWGYGIARYAGDEFRFYRAFGLGTRPSYVVRRSSLQVSDRRSPGPDELHVLPAHAVIVDCHDTHGSVSLAFGASAYTGFVSWLEAAAPLA
jgi:hypothetical protein